MPNTWESMQDLLNSYWFLVAEVDRMTNQLKALGCTFENGAWVYSPELVAQLDANESRSAPPRPVGDNAGATVE